MEAFVQLSIKEYEQLKQRAEQQDIPVHVEHEVMYADQQVRYRFPARVDINMRELKLQICKQNGIDPDNTVVEFY